MSALAAPYLIAALVAAICASFVTAFAVAQLLQKAGFPIPEVSRRFACIDGLRGCLALCVIAHHFILWLQVTRLGGAWNAPKVALFNQLGAGAVSLFFMVTGLVFYPRILAGFGATPWRSVLIGRVFRIMPLIFTSIVIIVAVAAWRSGKSVRTTDATALVQWVSAWAQPDLVGYQDTGRINAYVLWSLKCEWMFYGIVLPVSAIMRDLTRGHLPSIVIPLSLCAAAIFDHFIHIPYAKYLPLFASGMFAYEISVDFRHAEIFRGRFSSIIASASLILAASIYADPLSPILPVFAFFFTCIVLGNDMFGVLRHPATLVLGEISFSIYLLHGIVLSLFFVEGHAFIDAVSITLLPVWLPVMSAIVVLFASGTYLAIERPAIRLGSRIARKVAGTRHRPVAIEADMAP